MAVEAAPRVATFRPQHLANLVWSYGTLGAHDPALFAAFSVSRPSVHVGLVLFGLLYAPIDTFLEVLLKKLRYASRSRLTSDLGEVD